MSTSVPEVLSRVEKELRALWSAPPRPGEPPKARACTMNLVVVVVAPASAREWEPIVDEVVQSLPARAIVVGLDPGGKDALDATVTAVCTPGTQGGPAVCSERVTLLGGGALCRRLPSCVDALRATDVPTTLVWVGAVDTDDPAFGPLAAQASRIVVDASHGSLATLGRVVRWVRGRADAERAGVADLTWTRLAPWQELCARMFDDPRLRALATRITRVVIVQASPPGTVLGPEGALLLGWLASRLGWKASSPTGELRLVRPDNAPVAARLRAEVVPGVLAGSLLAIELDAGYANESPSLRGRIQLEGSNEGDGATWCVRSTCGVETRQTEQRVRLRMTHPARLLESTLHRPRYDETLAQAAVWADALRNDQLGCK